MTMLEFKYWCPSVEEDTSKSGTKKQDRPSADLIIKPEGAEVSVAGGANAWSVPHG